GRRGALGPDRADFGNAVENDASEPLGSWMLDTERLEEQRAASTLVRPFVLLLAHELRPAAHVLGGTAIDPAGALHFEVVGVDEGERQIVHVPVLFRVEVPAAGELEGDL